MSESNGPKNTRARTLAARHPNYLVGDIFTGSPIQVNIVRSQSSDHIDSHESLDSHETGQEALLQELSLSEHSDDHRSEGDDSNNTLEERGIGVFADINMAENTFIPNSFNGRNTSGAAEWIERFNYYGNYRRWSDAHKLEAFPLFLRGSAYV